LLGRVPARPVDLRARLVEGVVYLGVLFEETALLLEVGQPVAFNYRFSAHSRKFLERL